MKNMMSFGLRRGGAGYERLATVDELQSPQRQQSSFLAATMQQGQQQLAAPTAAVAAAPAAPAASAPIATTAAVDPVTGEPQQLKPYQIYTLYSDDDDGLKYPGFMRLLDHLEIKLNREWGFQLIKYCS
jgi:hypothetical protein